MVPTLCSSAGATRGRRRYFAQFSLRGAEAADGEWTLATQLDPQIRRLPARRWGSPLVKESTRFKLRVLDIASKPLG